MVVIERDQVEDQVSEEEILCLLRNLNFESLDRFPFLRDEADAGIAYTSDAVAAPDLVGDRRGRDEVALVAIFDGIEMINAIVAGHPGVIFGLHICRGNDASRYMAKGSYAQIAGIVFRRVDLEPPVDIPAHATNVTETTLGTTLAVDGGLTI